MKKAFFLLGRMLLFMGGFCAALWFFMPWREVGASALSLASKRLEQRGMRLVWSDVEAVETGQGFTVRGLSLGGFMTLTFDSLTLRPQLLPSIMALAPVCDVAFRGGAMTMGQPMDFGGGGFLVTAGSSEVLLERLRADGDFGLQGFLSIDPARMKINRAEAALKIPPSFEGNMDSLRGFLPLVKEGNGSWFLRRGRAERRTQR